VATLDPLGRFSSRVDDYARYRPSYPPEVVSLLERECGLNKDSTIADVGSGTGLLSKLLLDAGWRVLGVEPNPDMRRAGEFYLSQYDAFQSVDGRAEATNLPDSSVDLVTAAQAFHWFEANAARAEFSRILRRPKWVAIIWNERVVPSEGFLHGYEQLLQRYAPEYSKVDHRRIDSDRITEFFGHSDWKLATFDNRQDFDLAGVRGRLESSSYAPRADHPSYASMIDQLHALFAFHQKDGQVSFLYETKVYYGRL
jgi:SAM-dependent methyltransferase